MEWLDRFVWGFGVGLLIWLHPCEYLWRTQTELKKELDKYFEDTD